MYGDLARANVYFEERGSAAWEALDSDQALSALVRGSSNLDALYGSAYIGQPTGGINQEDLWPRKGKAVAALGLAEDEVPLRVEHASYEMALLSVTNPNLFSGVYDPAKNVKKVVVGPVSKEYAVPSSFDAEYYKPKSAMIEGLLAPLLKSRKYPLPVALVV